jgi:hypothetical protein
VEAAISTLALYFVSLLLAVDPPKKTIDLSPGISMK